MKFFKRAGLNISNHPIQRTFNVAWCGAFVHWCLTETPNLRESPENEKVNYEGQEKRPVNALGWRGNRDHDSILRKDKIEPYGEEVNINQPFLGAIIVVQSKIDKKTRPWDMPGASRGICCWNEGN